ncbi:MAG: formyltransferase family protein, partial [Sulfurimonas sp.]
MKISLLITTFNSTSQLAYTYLKEQGHSVDVVYAINDVQMLEEIEAFKPELILCPFLKKFVSSEIYNNYPTFILHPGIRGDKGAYSLDNAIREERDEWGVVYLRANDEFDGGSIYAEKHFEMRQTYKASLYRNEVNIASLQALRELLCNVADENFIPTPQLPTSLHKQLTQKDRAIDWQNDTTKAILKKIYMSDSLPGVFDEILGVECYLYGAWEEEKLRGEKPKEILAKRDGAICLATVNGAVWITHLKEVGRFKLPATYVLKERLKGVK